MKQLKNFTIFTNEGWRQSTVLKNTNRKTGVFDEEDGIENDLENYDSEIDEAFQQLFDQPSFEDALFGGNFAEYLDARETQRQTLILEKYQKLFNAFTEFKEILINDLRDAYDNYGH